MGRRPRSRGMIIPRVFDFHALVHRFEQRLPQRIARISFALRQPHARLWRIPAALLLIVGGIFSFLPVLGIWMLPLGLLLLAVDVPRLQPPMARLLDWIERKWPAKPKPPQDQV